MKLTVLDRIEEPFDVPGAVVAAAGCCCCCSCAAGGLTG